ncbi:LysR family transcriptional regulator [Rhizobium cauense]|uniref:LysR family transcriptional regulator n=1 Tax=Rhizobium cauense TaxID=1166683 RepID=UPI001C6F3E25|nr:LysR family transcriptional regulator [Rhizobium cauense]MBW9114703.1 LysR family transcriptional regulator [Rhizobium cauense]
MEWSDLRLFLAIARCGTLGAAARSLGLTQPTMGRRLKALEASLGHILFQRTPDGFVLTSEGTLVLSHAVRIEQETMGLERQLAGGERHLEGHLRISCSDWFGVHVLAPLLSRFAGIHPRISIEILTESRLLDLSRLEADIVFRITPFTAADVVARKLVSIEYALYQAAMADDANLENPSGVSLITMDEAFSEMPDVAWMQQKFPGACIAMRSNNRDVQAELCAGGVGLAVLPRPLGDARRDLRELAIDDRPPSRATWVGYHRDLRQLPRLRAFVDFVVEEIGTVISMRQAEAR